MHLFEVIFTGMMCFLIREKNQLVTQYYYSIVTEKFQQKNKV